MDFRVGSAPARSHLFGHGGLLLADSNSEPPLSGFLNRKCVTEAGGKKSKDRHWQTFWCQLKGLALEFHRVEGVKSEGSKPPPRDIYPLPHLSQYKAGFVSLEGATADVDYTSQLGKDLHKRRDYLFELTLANNILYLVQAPNVTQRAQWVQQINRASKGYTRDDIDGRSLPDTKIKAARCSVRHRSRQNVLSLKAGQVVVGEEEEVDAAMVVREHPDMQLLRDRLRAKKELLTQLNRMYCSFLGDTRQLYSEDVRRAVGAASSMEPVSSPRPLSLPPPFFSTVTPAALDDARRASTGTFSSSHAHPSVRSRVLHNYLLVPGAGWSQLRGGEEVVLTGRLPGGWFRCLVQRDASAIVRGLGSESVSSLLSEASRDSGLPPSNRHSAASDTLAETSPSHRPDEKTAAVAAPTSTGREDGEMFVSDTLTEDDDACTVPESGAKSHDQSHDQSHNQDKSSPPRLMRVGRSYSYLVATENSIEDTFLPESRRSLDSSMVHRGPHRGSGEAGVRGEGEGGVERNRPGSLQLNLKLTQLAESNAHTNRYTFPLVGALPGTVVEQLPEMADLPLLQPAAFPSLSPSHSARPLSSPAHSFTYLDTPQHSGSHQQPNGHITTPTHHHSHSHSHSLVPAAPSPSQSPLPARRPMSSSAPVSPNSTPTHTPSPSPIPPAPHTTPTLSVANGDLTEDHMSHSVSAGNKLSNSPSHRPRVNVRRRSHDPVTAIIESGPSFIKRLFPRKKVSIPDNKLSVTRTPTIEEEVPVSPSPSPFPPSPPSSPLPPPASPLPPPAMLDFEQDFGVDNMRTRMSSMSGRPIRSTGIALVIGEEESSSDSEPESSNEESDMLSQSFPPTRSFSVEGTSLPSTSRLTSALLPPRLSPDIMAPGNLRRAASAHDSLNIKVDPDPEPISPATRGKSGSTHSLKSGSLTSTLVRGLQASFRRAHPHEEEPAKFKKRSTSRKKRRGSCSEGTDLESPKLGGIFRQPPTGQKRFVYLDPRQPKHGFRLESYGRRSEQGKEIQVFVQSVNPGSPAFMSGLFPGDTILEVNGASVRYEPVAAVVKRIMDVPRSSENKVQLTVMFADGVTRLEKMKKADHYKYQMKVKQAQLRVTASEESSHMTRRMTTPNPPNRNIVLATDLQPWSQQATPTDPSPQMYPYDSVLNELVTLYCGPPSELATDALVLPLCRSLRREHDNMLTQLLREGGPDLLDELSLSTYCPLGENITTSGCKLPAHTVFHCVFGNLEENLHSCVCSALEEGSSEKRATIAFWLDGFTAINVSPHSVMESVRLWLQQSGNSNRFKKVVFSAATNPDFAETLLQRYFPPTHYQFKISGPKNTGTEREGGNESTFMIVRSGGGIGEQGEEEEEEEGGDREREEEEGREEGGSGVGRGDSEAGGRDSSIDGSWEMLPAATDEMGSKGSEGSEVITRDQYLDNLYPGNSDGHSTSSSQHLSPWHSHHSTPSHSPSTSSSSPRILNPLRLESDV